MKVLLLELRRGLGQRFPNHAAIAIRLSPMPPDVAKEFLILGLTRDGKTFRPTDWAERLAGVMSQFRPGGPQRGSHLGYSPWCVPSVRDGVRCVVVQGDLRDSDVLAWDFCVNFARDNDLQVLTVPSEANLS